MRSDLLSPLFASAEMQTVLSDRERVRAMLAFEAALAASEADAGLIPADAAAAITAACASFEPDMAAIGDATRRAGNPAIPFVKALTAHCAEPGRGCVHWGATSQDVIDTANALMFREAMALIDRETLALGDALAAQAEAHRSTVMPGRTLLQPALPITFGFKVAGWLDMVMRCRAALKTAAEQGLVLQFGGAVGTLAAIGSKATTVRQELGRRLDLPVPDIAWHTARDRGARIGAELAILTEALAKIAGDIALLMQAEVGEAAEPAGSGRGGSSTMPQKRNPVAAPAVRANAMRASGLASALLSAMPQEHERGAGGWHAEWTILPDLFEIAAGALGHVTETIADLEVRPQRMRANLDIGNGTLMSEALMMALAPTLGRQEAHHVVEAAARRAIAENRPLADICRETDEIVDGLGLEGIATALDPSTYLGIAEATVDTVVSRWKTIRN
ncbi:3-carboxy-cis,cis-muconate cycloisomerase [Microbaculum marinisediminis]|uniref:3-carboxy-cis,cis-muconate cycloisomerase n=1 Tax=Microbaculum marinisediminis TaxID=2931392 RepID=A0AAW5R0L4_9HYPH|nr:3-carboxy-cis,cis-muconate cycloisomerase [Microbaculum sp. A6E488]MCT8972865.1 3-carboxy-cis,cis-muconate cycloisomerase [Microbaculum sp. A6E488]